MGMLVWPMIAMGWVVNLMQRGTASLSRIHEILDERPSIAAPPSPKPVPPRGEIEFRGVAVEVSAGRALDGIDLGSAKARRWPWWDTPAAARPRWCT